MEYLLRHDANVLTVLKGNGDFRSEECLGMLDDATWPIWRRRT